MVSTWYDSRALAVGLLAVYLILMLKLLIFEEPKPGANFAKVSYYILL